MSNARNLAQTAVVSQRSRNRVDNGDMSVWQRPTSGPLFNGSSIVDRWCSSAAGTGVALSLSRTNNDGPSWVMPTSIKYQTSTNASAVTEFVARQWIELNTVRDMFAKKCVLSFWYKSNRVGQHVARIISNQAVGSAGGADLTYTFNVNQAGAWEYKSFQTDAFLNLTSWGSGDGTNAAVIVDIGWKNTNGGIATMATTDYFCLTGVQLEIGTVPTAFEFLTPQENLLRCQRYIQIKKAVKFWGYSITDTAVGGPVFLTAPMRVAPIVVVANNAYGNCRSLTCEQITTEQTSVYALINATGSFNWISDFLFYADFF